MNNILIIGSGGREHAIGEKIKNENRNIIFAPGNGGTEKEFSNVDIGAHEIDKLIAYAKNNDIDFTIVGPEVPLSMGIVDEFEKNGLKIFGVKQKAAKFEASKAYTKAFLDKYQIETADYLETSKLDEAIAFGEKLLETDGRLVIKRDGLAAGKGVSIVDKYEDLQELTKEILDLDGNLVIEQFIDGFEMSLLAFTDSKTMLALPTAKDHKKIFDNEMGPNTGGMGTYAPNIEAEAYREKIEKEILPQILSGIQSEGIDFKGVLFIGFMINERGIYVLEFNVRFGDPETQVVLELIDNDLLDLMVATSEGKLSDVSIKENNKKAVCLVLASEGYPADFEKNREITFDEGIRSKIYHGGTRLENAKLLTNGGRVLNLVSVADDFESAIENVYADAKKVHFDGKYYRKDIGPRVKRVYVKKRPGFNNESINLKNELESSLNISLGDLQIYKRYDLETSKENLDKIIHTVLSEAQVDEVFSGQAAFDLEARLSQRHILVSQYQAGQFDQREQGVIDTASLIIDDPDFAVAASTVYEIDGVDDKTLEKIEAYIINPVDSEKAKLLGIPSTLRSQNEKNLENIVYDGFRDYDDVKLSEFLEDNSMAMSQEDLKLIQEYFVEEDRDPNETEIKILDTYWSDHCRHTTFNTYLDIEFDTATLLDEAIRDSFEKYLQMRRVLNIEKPINLMSFGTILAKYMRANDNFADLEVSKEINACSIYTKVRVEVDGKEKIEDYLLMFKNETHNHPTEIEPFGGASTCLGGAIRDPLSGRAYVYQAMRLSGAANILEDYNQTLAGKLPQAKITKEAAHGYSSYGNQIGLATGLVDEFYHEGYKAKRLECGAVIAAAPVANVKRLDPVKGDLVILLGGKTGRDGIGGATGSSKSHKVTSIETESAQVQKGNAPEERKIQRLFRNGELARLIKKSNDFGAGGVSVAIGELHDGIDIYLDRVPLKYQGLKPFEIAISESQERMAVVIDPKDYEKFMEIAHGENLEATHVATITDNNYMTLYYEDEIMGKLSYDFINKEGADRYADVAVVSEDIPSLLTKKSADPEIFYDKVKSLDVTSKVNLIEMFDSTVGRGTVINPLGGRYLMNPAQVMAARIPTDEGVSKTVSLMTYGFDPHLAEASQYLGGYYAVVESIAKLVAVGSDLEQIRLTFQEYYESMTSKEAWSKPLKSLLGAFEVSNYFMMPPIGGKDSMSGTFEDIKVPPSLISFAVTTEDIENLITNDFKNQGKIGLVYTPYKEDGTLDLGLLEENFKNINKDIRDGNIISAIALTRKGLLADLFEQSIGNTGFDIKYDNLYNPMFGSFLVEYKQDRKFIEHLGESAGSYIVNGIELDTQRLADAYGKTLDKIFLPKETILAEDLKPGQTQRRLKSKKPTDHPHVIILAAPGTNSEWDTAEAFKKAGATTEIVVFKNQNIRDIQESIDELAEAMEKAQIFAIPGGFSLGDEPDGSAKFLANILRNEKIEKAINHVLYENDGLMIGICNGFQALVKTGLLPYGRVTKLTDKDPTLTYNTKSRHISSFVSTKTLTTNSPWTVGMDLDQVYRIPISHGEGRFVISEEKLQDLLAKDQIFSVYEVSPNGSDYNIEGIISEDGKILGRMGHGERVDDDLFINVYQNEEGPFMDPIDQQAIFDNAVKYFRKDS